MTTAAIFLALRLTLAALLLAMLLVILVQLRRGLRPAPPAVGLPMACLAPESPTHDQPSYPLAGTNTIGRAPGNSITLDHPSVSSYHARLSFGSGHWLLEDLGSRNGTRVNGLEVREPLAITYGDWVQIGSVALRLLAGGVGSPGVPAGPVEVTTPVGDAQGPPAPAGAAMRGGTGDG